MEGCLVQAEPVLVALDTASGRESRGLPQRHVVTQSLLQELRRLQLGLIEAYDASCGNGLVCLTVVEAEDRLAIRRGDARLEVHRENRGDVLRSLHVEDHKEVILIGPRKSEGLGTASLRHYKGHLILV